MRMMIHFSFTLGGFHYYPKAKREDIKQRHFHPFLFTCYVEVFHDDREVEFLDLRERIVKHFKTKYGDPESMRPLEFGTLSCEQLCRVLASCVYSVVGERDRRLEIIVSEADQHAGAYFVCESPEDLQTVML